MGGARCSVCGGPFRRIRPICQACGTVRGSGAGRAGASRAGADAAARLAASIGDVPGNRLLLVGGAFEPLAETARQRGLHVEQIERMDEIDGDGYGAIVLVHALEAAEEPRTAIARCAALVAADGALALVAFEPSARLRRRARQLVPAAVLRELIAGEGLVVSSDTRIGPGERAVVAHRIEVVRPTEPLAAYRGGDVTVHAVLPSYNAAATLGQVADELPRGAVDRALVVDDVSGDATAAVASDRGFDLLLHRSNRGYGGSQKTGYARALLDGADIVVMIHGDNQYDPGLVAAMVEPIRSGEADMVIGSRLLGRALAGGMPRWKWIGNRFLTGIENLAFGRRLSEYHSGYRAYSAELLRSIAFLRGSDGFSFDQEIVAQAVARGARIAEIAIPTRYFPEASSVDFRTSVTYGLRTVLVALRFVLYRLGLRWPLLSPPVAELRAAEVVGVPAQG